MARTFLAIIFGIALISSVSAQTRGEAPPVTPEMEAVAQTQTDLVHSTVTLSDEQRGQVYDIFVDHEQLWTALKLRMAGSGMSAEEQALELDNMVPSVDQRLDQKLAQVLTPEQVSLWMEAKQ